MWQVKLAWDIGLFLSPLRGYRHLDFLCPGAHAPGYHLIGPSGLSPPPPFGLSNLKPVQI